MQTAGDALPCGSYRIVETSAPEGYLAWDGTLEFAIESDGQVVDLTGDPVSDDVIRGGVQVVKADASSASPRRSVETGIQQRVSARRSLASSSP